MQKTIIYKMLKGDELNIDDETLSFFEPQFQNWYNAIKKAIEFEWELNSENVQLASFSNNVILDATYPNYSVPFETEIKSLYDVCVKGFEEKYFITRMKNLVVEYDKNKDPKVLEQINKLTQSNRKQNLNALPLSDYKVEQEDFIHRVRNRIPQEGVYIYKYGQSQQFKQLSKVLRIFSPSDFVVIAGKQSVGKTSFVLSLANVLCKNGYRGMFFSLEMTNAQLLDRLALAKGGLPKDRVFPTDGSVVDDYTLNEYLKALEEVSQLPLMVVDNVPKTWIDMENLIRKHKDDIDFIMIDYLGLISSYDGKDSTQPKHIKIENISRGMKLLAKELGKPIITLAQFNRNTSADSKNGQRDDDKYAEPFMRDLKDSSSIEQDADKIILLYRKKESKEEREKHESEYKYLMHVKVEKNRAGATKTLDYEFNGALLRWKEVDK